MFQPSRCLSSLLLSVLHFSTNGRFCNHERLLFSFFWDICVYFFICLLWPEFFISSLLLYFPFFPLVKNLAILAVEVLISTFNSLPVVFAYFCMQTFFSIFVKVIVGEEYHYLLVRTDLLCIRGGLNISRT